VRILAAASSGRRGQLTVKLTLETGDQQGGTGEVRWRAEGTLGSRRLVFFRTQDAGPERVLGYMFLDIHPGPGPSVVQRPALVPGAGSPVLPADFELVMGGLPPLVREALRMAGHPEGFPVGDVDRYLRVPREGIVTAGARGVVSVGGCVLHEVGWWDNRQVVFGRVYDTVVLGLVDADGALSLDATGQPVIVTVSLRPVVRSGDGLPGTRKPGNRAQILDTAAAGRKGLLLIWLPTKKVWGQGKVYWRVEGDIGQRQVVFSREPGGPEETREKRVLVDADPSAVTATDARAGGEQAGDGLRLVPVARDGLCALAAVLVSIPPPARAAVAARLGGLIPAGGPLARFLAGGQVAVRAAAEQLSAVIGDYLAHNGHAGLPADLAPLYRAHSRPGLTAGLAAMTRDELVRELAEREVRSVPAGQYINIRNLADMYTAAAGMPGAAGGRVAADWAARVAWTLTPAQAEEAARDLIAQGIDPEPGREALREQYLTEMALARGPEARAVQEEQWGWTLADTSPSAEEMFDALPDPPSLEVLDDGELVALLADVIIAAPRLADDEFARLLDAVGTWEQSWAGLAGEAFPVLLAHVLGIRLRVLNRPEAGQAPAERVLLGPDDGPQVTVFYDAYGNHYDAAGPAGQAGEPAASPTGSEQAGDRTGLETSRRRRAGSRR
jgi:hypothetical protein